MIDLEKEKKTTISLVDDFESINDKKDDILERECFCGKSNAEHEEADKKIDRLLEECAILIDDIKRSRERYNVTEAERVILRARNDETEAKIRRLKIQRIKSLVYSFFYYLLMFVIGFYLGDFMSVVFTVFKMLYSKFILIFNVFS
jgi:hypothetical protein